jgi:TetR/AcrR family transcriptional regulator, tetracycline repressor protein
MTDVSRPAVKGRKRRARGIVSREVVVNAAVSAIESGRYESMTMRSLAQDIGVAPMSIYRHVKSRDDLLDEVADRLLERHWRPPTEHDDWRRWTMEAVARFRGILVDYPAVLSVYLRHPVDSPAAMVRMDEMLARFTRAGFSREAALDAYAALHTYSIGFAAMESSRSEWNLQRRETSGSTKRLLATFASSEQFEKGLRLLLNGIDPASR